MNVPTHTHTRTHAHKPRIKDVFLTSRWIVFQPLCCAVLLHSLCCTTPRVVIVALRELSIGFLGAIVCCTSAVCMLWLV